VQIDALALQMRPRAPQEAADLGVRLCQTTAGAVFRCYLVVAVPFAVLALALFDLAPWLPSLLVWWAKPWLDRTVLFVLARAAFGQQTTLGDLWREQRNVWWRQFIVTWTWRRLSPWRSFTQPVYQLEGHAFFQLRRRVLQLRRRYGGSAIMMTMAFGCAELFLTLAIVSLAFWFTPPELDFDFQTLLNGEAHTLALLIGSVAYVFAVLFLEPFYVAAGFGMYLNRRAELEAWDIEQEFRRAFAS
jgi:hypothetical protein